MTEQEVISLINSLSTAANRRQGLSDIQSLVLKGVWRGDSYQEIGSQFGYDPDYIRQVGARLWQLLGEITGQKVSKSNLRTVFEAYQQQVAKSNVINDSFALVPASPQEDWEIRWVGRTIAVEQLSRALVKRSRISILVGITGIGKSSLAVRVTLDHLVRQHWSSVKIVHLDAESDNFSELARQVAGEQILRNLDLANPKQLLATIIEHLQAHPCILIVDMLEEVLKTSDKGTCEYTEPLFGQLFDCLLQASEMRSRIIITSQVQPPAIAEGRYPNRSHLLRLRGLVEAEAIELFQVWDINPTSDLEFTYLYRTIKVYEGHPLALRVIAGEIREPPYCGDIKAYWHDYGRDIESAEHYKEASSVISTEDSIPLTDYSVALTDLVKNRVEISFARLKKSAPLSYFLLCMGSVYRRAVDRSAWSILIADRSPHHQAAAFQVLQRRFLLEEEYASGKVLYRLHNLVRAVALQHLHEIESRSLP